MIELNKELGLYGISVPKETLLYAIDDDHGVATLFIWKIKPKPKTT